MPKVPAKLVDGPRYGPAMSALPPRMRAFVIAMYEVTQAPVDAARAAGYKDNGGSGIRVQAHTLMHDERVVAAMIEEGKRRLTMDLPMASGALRQIASNPQHKDQVKAALALLSRGGIPNVIEQHLTVEIMTPQQKDDEIRRLALELGTPVEHLLGVNVVDPNAIDVEHTDVVDLEDIL